MLLWMHLGISTECVRATKCKFEFENFEILNLKTKVNPEDSSNPVAVLAQGFKALGCWLEDQGWSPSTVKLGALEQGP